MGKFGVLAVVCLSALAASQLPIAASLLPPVPAVVHPSASVVYHDLAAALWGILVATDNEETCISPSHCPCQGILGVRVGILPGQCTAIPTGARCGGVSRVWYRMILHDCGTFNVNDFTGGCDGSLQHELDRPENADGMAAAITAYKLAISTTMAKLHNIGKPNPSMADTILIAGMLGLAKCAGPIIPVVPGRKDSAIPNLPYLLPDKDESIGAILAKMARASFTAVDTVVLVGSGHTMSKLHGRNLDGTPDRFDNRFFVELLARAGNKLPSDLAMLGNSDTLQGIKYFAENEAAFRDQAALAIDKMMNLIPVFRSPPPSPPPARKSCPWYWPFCY